MTIAHSSDCALHNAPACEPRPCDCGATDILERIKIELAIVILPKFTERLLAECAITIKALRAAFLKYGDHLDHCPAVIGEKCECGFSEAVK